jgi:hypothetical protein
LASVARCLRCKAASASQRAFAGLVIFAARDVEAALAA